MWFHFSESEQRGLLSFQREVLLRYQHRLPVLADLRLESAVGDVLHAAALFVFYDDQEREE